MKFFLLGVVLLLLLVSQTVLCDNLVVLEPEIDIETVEDEHIDDIEDKKNDDDDHSSHFETMTIVASVDGRLHGFDANNNKKWTSDSSGPLSSHHSSGNLIDFSGMYTLNDYLCTLLIYLTFMVLLTALTAYSDSWFI